MNFFTLLGIFGGLGAILIFLLSVKFDLGFTKHTEGKVKKTSDTIKDMKNDSEYKAAKKELS